MALVAGAPPTSPTPPAIPPTTAEQAHSDMDYRNPDQPIANLLPQADAVVAAWLPGSEGQGVAGALFGDYPFTGKLPYTWPRSVEQLPFDFENPPSAGSNAPLFPYGYNLHQD